MKQSRVFQWGMGLVILITAGVAAWVWWIGAEEGPATKAEYDAMITVQRTQGHVETNPKGHVTQIVYAGARIQDDDLAVLNQFPDLELLSLERTPITDDGLAHLAGLNELKFLSLKTTNVTDAGLIHLRELPSLEELDLEYTRVTDAGLANLAAISSLRKVYFGPGGPTADGLGYLKSKNPKLEVFSGRR